MRIGFAIFALGLFFTQTGQIAAADLPAAMDVPVPPQEERGIWAAIAYSEADQKHGFFWGADKRQEAMDTALNHCRNAGGNECCPSSNDLRLFVLLKIGVSGSV
ncbi:DUF4189 domain-containing protein [Brucella intermedia]|uniref:DUF4189 domain-containing protein n=1 Tax=Brucella intermedia TaxID=94625 RepID=UPI003F584954